MIDEIRCYDALTLGHDNGVASNEVLDSDVLPLLGGWLTPTYPLAG